MELAHNEGYVLASYAITAVAMVIIIGWVYIDSRSRQRELKRLDEAGIRRRSARTAAADQTVTGKTSDA
ncbi:heme exporter protein CcmD [Rhizobium sp. C4]|uniref:heme exporter protein CcmD n=1 Tax=Rhizobium sp. C4 TaxID=1349800 RepID=UPI001E3EF3B5|nr:heme exporter protein CcmD [Rhizobium sp. C4]MCD2175797.1 heme exporter protein CcmD [Rhizobium sp. C4]